MLMAVDNRLSHHSATKDSKRPKRGVSKKKRLPFLIGDAAYNENLNQFQSLSFRYDIQRKWRRNKALARFCRKLAQKI